MALNITLENLSKLVESHPLEPAFLKREETFAETLLDKNPMELTEKIAEHLKEEARPGSSEYMKVFSASAVLDAEVKMLEEGRYDPVLLQEKGLQPMLDEKGGLTQDAHADLLGAMHSLNYRLTSYISRTAQTASEYYAAQLTTPTSLVDRVKQVVGVKSEPYEIPFTPNATELKILSDLAERKYLSQDEARQAYQQAINSMMRNRPDVMGCAVVASTTRYIQGIIENMGGSSTGSSEIEKICRLHEIMKGQAMDELQIYEQFGVKIEDCVNESVGF
jgi:hypothetical protein